MLIQKKLDDLTNKKVDAMVLQCQTCYLMYSDQQNEINQEYDRQYNLPVILYPQLLGLAVGADPREDLGLKLHTISPDKILTKVT